MLTNTKLQNIMIYESKENIKITYSWTSFAILNELPVYCVMYIQPQSYDIDFGWLWTMTITITSYNVPIIYCKITNQQNHIGLFRGVWVYNNSNDIQISYDAKGTVILGTIGTARLLTELSDTLLILSDNTKIQNAMNNLREYFETIRLLAE